jgi:hypothetical protein
MASAVLMMLGLAVPSSARKDFLEFVLSFRPFSSLHSIMAKASLKRRHRVSQITIADLEK